MKGVLSEIHYKEMTRKYQESIYFFLFLFIVYTMEKIFVSKH